MTWNDWLSFFTLLFEDRRFSSLKNLLFFFVGDNRFLCSSLTPEERNLYFFTYLLHTLRVCTAVLQQSILPSQKVILCQTFCKHRFIPMVPHLLLASLAKLNDSRQKLHHLSSLIRRESHCTYHNEAAAKYPFHARLSKRADGRSLARTIQQTKEGMIKPSN